MTDFESQVAAALLEAMPITEGPALEHRRPLAEILAVRVSAAIEAAGAECLECNGHEHPVKVETAALAALRGSP